MTGVEDAEGVKEPKEAEEKEKSVGHSRVGLLSWPLRPYAEIFRIPGAWRFSAAGIIGRLPMSMFGLGTVLLVSAVTGEYGLAGAVSAIGSLGYAFTSPRIARLVDAHGQRRVLLHLLAWFALSTAALIAATVFHLPIWAFFVSGAVAGSTMPSLGALVRVRWSVLLAGSPRLHAAFAFESIADELSFIVGPAAVTLLATQVSPAAGVGVAALLCVLGTLWFAAQRNTEPPVNPQVPMAGERTGFARARGLAAPGLGVLGPVYLLLGAMFVSIDLSTVAFAQHLGHKSLAGFVLGAYAFGSATGGIWYGSRLWRAPQEKRFALALTLTVLGVATFWVQPNLLTLTCVIYLSGLAIAPTLIAGFSLLEAQAKPGRRTEAMSWLSSGISVGVAAGASLVGFVIDAHGPRFGYGLAALYGVVSVGICLLGMRRLRSVSADDTLSRTSVNDAPAATKQPRSATQESVGDDKVGAAPRGGGDAGGFSGRGAASGGDPPVSRRYLVGQCQETVPVGKPFSLLASIVLAERPLSAELDPFGVPPEGRDVLLVMYAPGLQLLSDQQQKIHVPAERDSRPARFELCADTAGPVSMSITAWIGGNNLGELRVEITAERDRSPGPQREVFTEITTEPAEGAVSLVVRYDPVQQAYRFEFRDEDYPDEVHSNLAYDPAPLVEQLVADLDNLVKGRSGYSAAQTRDYLTNAGARLWRHLIPGQLREQFWDRQRRIRQLTILTDKDTVPWELLYPMDPGHDAGFLVEQFPVTHAIFGWRPARTLRLQPARFVLPEDPLPAALMEVNAMRRLLDPGQAPEDIISALTPLTDLIGSGDFGLLHFACHNTYDPIGGSSIKLGNVQFTPTLLEVAVIQKVLQRSAPTIFINACRSAGLTATYNQLDGWARKFLEAGAAAFIGSLWAVSDGAAREFAQELYLQLQAGFPLGEAVMQARRVAASQPDDPTWLAYTVYGDPRATISRRP
jgi:MFS family permease